MVVQNAVPIDIGIAEKDRRVIAEGLSALLADSYLLYVKTHNYHWNVTGPMFQALHAMFEQQYTELALAVDEIAERIRALGVRAPGSYAEFARLASVQESEGSVKAMDMVADLVKSHETVARTARSIFDAVQQADDQPTADLLTRRLEIHEKTAWMLRSLLEE